MLRAIAAVVGLGTRALASRASDGAGGGRFRLEGRLRLCADFIERAINKRRERVQAAFKYAAGRTSDGQASCSKRLERQLGSTYGIAQLVHEKADALINRRRLLTGQVGVSLGAELCHGVHNGVVEAPVQVRNSPALKGASLSTARPLIAWHRSP